MRSKTSYSQCGEDIISDFVLTDIFGISNPVYIDIGAHHPIELSNTYYFYLKGCRGICVEPNPDLCAEHVLYRPNDVTLNIGIGVDFNESAEYFKMTSTTLNTFSKETALNYESMGEKIQEIFNLPVYPVNMIISHYLNGIKPNYVSIDIEGYELEILRTFDFINYRPEVFCIETLNYDTNRLNQKKNTEVFELMRSNQYFLYADTYINSIFVDLYAWLK